MSCVLIRYSTVKMRLRTHGISQLLLVEVGGSSAFLSTFLREIGQEKILIKIMRAIKRGGKGGGERGEGMDWLATIRKVADASYLASDVGG